MSHEEQIVHAVQKVMPAVVSITATKDLEDIKRAARKLAPFGYPMPDGSIGSPEDLTKGIPTNEDGRVRMGGGSGFIVDPSGIILTNRHVVMDQDAEYTIITHAEETHPVEVVARDPIHDIAILRIPRKGKKPLSLPRVEFSKEDPLDLGQTVIAIGNALGEFRNSVSTGVISGLSRLISAITDMSGHQERLRGLIQTDAAINPGNSGGPLVDIDGNVIGVNVAIVFGAQNIGFAIPIKKAERDLDDIRTHGRIRRPFLGVRYILLNKQIAKRFKLPVAAGALILKESIPGDHAIIPGSAAEKGGIKEGDILLSCNNHLISEKNALEDMLENYSIGDYLHFELLHNGKEKKNVKIRLEERL